MTGGREDTNVRQGHPTIVGTTHSLIPRGLTHVSKGRAERFISDTRAIFRARLHLGRYGQKWLKSENVARRLETREVHTYMTGGPDGHRGSEFRISSFLKV